MQPCTTVDKQDKYFSNYIVKMLIRRKCCTSHTEQKQIASETISYITQKKVDNKLKASTGQKIESRGVKEMSINSCKSR